MTCAHCLRPCGLIALTITGRGGETVLCKRCWSRPVDIAEPERKGKRR